MTEDAAAQTGIRDAGGDEQTLRAAIRQAVDGLLEANPEIVINFLDSVKSRAGQEQLVTQLLEEKSSELDAAVALTAQARDEGFTGELAAQEYAVNWLVDNVLMPTLQNSSDAASLSSGELEEAIAEFIQEVASET